ncbi:cyclodeaminase/cyclohydrolase family protein, partial [Chloroflexota bacterium]
AQMQEVLLQSEKLREELTELVKEDADAFTYVLNAFKLPKDSKMLEEVRSKAIEDATLYAAKIPMEVAEASLRALALAEKVVLYGNLNTISDGGSAGALAIASLRSAAYNVRINLSYLNNRESGISLLSKLEHIEKRAKELDIQLSKALEQRGGI